MGKRIVDKVMVAIVVTSGAAMVAGVVVVLPVVVIAKAIAVSTGRQAAALVIAATIVAAMTGIISAKSARKKEKQARQLEADREREVELRRQADQQAEEERLAEQKREQDLLQRMEDLGDLLWTWTAEQGMALPFGLKSLNEVAQELQKLRARIDANPILKERYDAREKERTQRRHEARLEAERQQLKREEAQKQLEERAKQQADMAEWDRMTERLIRRIEADPDDAETIVQLRRQRNDKRFVQLSEAEQDRIDDFLLQIERWEAAKKAAERQAEEARQADIWQGTGGPPKPGTTGRGWIRKVWPHEARDFTPWLARHLELVSDCTGLNLRLEGMEVPTVGGRVDIVARDNKSRLKVVIENQLDSADFDHFRQLVFYGDTQHAKIRIWIAADFSRKIYRDIRDQNQLNESRPDGAIYYLLELRPDPRSPISLAVGPRSTASLRILSS